MAKCKKIVRTVTRVCAGSLNRQVKIKVREIQPPKNNDTDFGIKIDDYMTVYAMINPVTGVSIFDETNVERTISHEIYIRYIPDLTFEKILEVARINEAKSDFYDILNVQNLDDNYRFYKLQCNIRGDNQVPINWN